MIKRVMQKNWFSFFNVKVTVWAYMIKIWVFLLCLLNCCMVCNQSWFCSTASEAREFYGKIGRLRSRSNSQQRFKNVGNVCLDDIFWSAEHFFTKLGMVMQHHEPECHTEKKKVCYLQGQGHSKGSCDQNMTLSTISSTLLISWQQNLVWWYIIISQSVLWKKMDNCIQSQGHSEGSKCQCLSRWYLLNTPNILLPNSVLWCITMSQSACKKIDLLFSGSRS